MISVGSGDCIFLEENQLHADKQTIAKCTKILNGRSHVPLREHQSITQPRFELLSCLCYLHARYRTFGRTRTVAKRLSSRPAGAAFDSAYFRKYYFNAATRVTTAAEMRGRAQLIAAILRHASVPVRSILDIGCGIGLLRKPFAEALPRARYLGLEASGYLCDRYGWTKASVVDYAPRSASDLVVCYDVLQYLDDRDAARAIANFATLTGAALYVSALTREDWRENCDRTRTDRAVHLRAGDWYRRRLRRRFNYLGFGVWLRKDATAILWDLERS
jgi:SAM-dependent methyltransferase